MQRIDKTIKQLIAERDAKTSELVELRQKVAQLEDTARFLDSIVQNAPMQIFIKEAEHLSYVLFNNVAEELMGATREDRLGKNAHDCYPKDIADSFTVTDRKVLAGRQLIDIPEEPLKIADGSIRYLHTKKVPILDVDGNPKYLLGISEDITELKQARERELEQTREIERAYQELRQTKDRLVQQEKMASLGQLTAGIAHEIKNPLNFINNFAEVNEELADELHELLGETIPVEVQEVLTNLRQSASMIAQHGKRADGIVHAMMQHASGGTGQRESIDVNQLVAEQIELAYHGKRAQFPAFEVAITRDLGVDVGVINVVAQEIGRVLLNLLSNAFDAVHEHAATAGGAFDPSVTVSTRQVDTHVKIRVKDNGAGIPADIRDKIFEPFFTTKPTGSGTGLGLSLSFDAVTQGHGGTLTVESSEGAGATFTVTLPMKQEKTESSA